MVAGIWALAAADGSVSPPPRSESIPAPARRPGRRPGARVRRLRRRSWCRSRVRRWRQARSLPVAGRGVGELGETYTGPGAGDGEPDWTVGCGAGGAGGGGDGDGGVGEDPAGFGFAAGTGEAEQDPVGVAGGGGQFGVAVELAGQAVEAFGPVVVLDQERQGGAVVGPDAVAVGADDFAPLPGAAPLGPPCLEPAGACQIDYATWAPV